MLDTSVGAGSHTYTFNVYEFYEQVHVFGRSVTNYFPVSVNYVKLVAYEL
jgi:hypothetical protein